MTIRDALTAVLQRPCLPGGARAATSETSPEWHAEAVLARELGSDWRRDYHAEHTAHASLSQQECPA